jgi:hypothetical protein
MVHARVADMNRELEWSRFSSGDRARSSSKKPL